MERPFFFKNSNDKGLYGNLFLPEQSTASCGIVLCQPIAEERCRVRKVFTNLARFLCANGYPVLLFDYFGEGDSEGNFEEATMSTRVSDIISAVVQIRIQAKVEKVTLVGLRLGATLAAMAARNMQNIESIVLCQPVVDAVGYFQDWLRSHLASQIVLYKKVVYSREQLVAKLMQGETLELDGYVISKDFYASLAKARLDTIASEVLPRALLLEIPARQGCSDKSISEFLKSHGSDFDHRAVSKTFDWMSFRMYNPSPEEYFNGILDWLQGVKA